MARQSNSSESVRKQEERLEAAFVHTDDSEYIPQVSKWANTEVSGVRSKVQESVQDAFKNDPFYSKNRVFLDKNFLDARKGFNFNNLTATKADEEKWMEPITGKWLKKHIHQMLKPASGTVRGRDIGGMVMPGDLTNGVGNKQLNRILAQFALQDQAEKAKKQFGEQEVAYDATIDKWARKTAVRPKVSPVPSAAKQKVAVEAPKVASVPVASEASVSAAPQASKIRVPVAYDSNPPQKPGLGARVKAKVSSLWKRLFS